MRIRGFSEEDTKQIISLFYETVHSINARDYSTDQLNAWAPVDKGNATLINWKKSLAHHMTYIAEINNHIVGFGDMSHTGYLDRLFVHKDFQNQGIATKLLCKLQFEAEQNNLTAIYTESSITAKPFFEHHGYKVIKKQSVERNGVTLPNFQMVKKINI